MRRRTEKLVAICRDPLDCERTRECLASSAVVDVVADCLSIAEAVGAIQRHSPDVLVLDLRLMSPAAVRRLAYSSARPMIVFLNSSGDPCHMDGLHRTATVTLADGRLFRRQVELTAELLPDRRPLVSTPRLLELLTNRTFRRNRQMRGSLNEALALLDVGEVAWLEGDDTRTALHGGETRIISLSIETVVDDFCKRGASFAMLSSSIAVNLARVQAVHAEKRGARTVVLDGGVTIGVAPDRVRSVIRQLSRRPDGKRRAPQVSRPAALAPRAVEGRHEHRAADR
jgi:DNA-binding LytR/AlgR family response regulator